MSFILHRLKRSNVKGRYALPSHYKKYSLCIDTVKVHGSKETTDSMLKMIGLLVEVSLHGIVETNAILRKLRINTVSKNEQGYYSIECVIEDKKRVTITLISLDTENKTGTIQVIKPSYLKYPDKYPNPDIRDFSYTSTELT